jgi:tRNA-dihydrouridine synthase 2
VEVTKSESQDLHQKVARAKSYLDIQGVMGNSSGEEDFQSIVKAIEVRPPGEHRMVLPAVHHEPSPVGDNLIVTPEGTQNPEPPTSGAPFLPNDFGKILPLPDRNATTPTPSGKLSLASM